MRASTKVRDILEEVVIRERVDFINDSPQYVAEYGIDGVTDMSDQDLYKEIRLNNYAEDHLRDRLRVAGINEDFIEQTILDVYAPSEED